MNKQILNLLIALAVAFSGVLVGDAKKPAPKPTRTPTVTPAGKVTQTPPATMTPHNTLVPSTPSKTATPLKTSTPGSPTVTVLPDDVTVPFPSAPDCEHPSNDTWHDLFDEAQGCHYDHEHGQDPFTPAVAAAFAPLGDLRSLLGGVGVGHTNPSSPAENVAKHGGFKWQVTLSIPNVCNESFEGGTIATKKAVIQFHAFGRQDVEHEARQHSTAAMFEFCKVGGDPNDVGYMYVVQLQEYGQRVTPYQGMTLTYPNSFVPQYISPRGPYFTNECEGQSTTFVDVDGAIRQVECRAPGDKLNNNNSIWTSKPTQSSGPRERPATSSLFRLLFRGRDMYQRMDINDLVHPFTWNFVCGGATFNPAGCRYNSSTFTVNEVMGDIPAAWDGASFDTDPRAGRVSANIFVTQFGLLRLSCTEAYPAVYTMTVDGMVVTDPGCYPLKLVNAFVGRYSSELQEFKVSNPTPENTPERDICFTSAGALAVCDTPGAVPSGWIGSAN